MIYALIHVIHLNQLQFNFFVSQNVVCIRHSGIVGKGFAGDNNLGGSIVRHGFYVLRLYV